MENSKIETIITESLIEMSKYNNSNDEKKASRIIIPYYRNTTESSENKFRYSEQELKQIFISLLEKEQNVYYSVETPTKYIYSFSSKKEKGNDSKEEPKIEKHKSKLKHFESARFDVSLYKTAETESLICHVEFKHKNPGDVLDISKDLLKLTNEIEEGKNNYFVHYIVRGDDWKSKTFPSVMKKYNDAILVKSNNQKYLGNVIVFLMFYDARNGERTIFRFDLRTFNDKYQNEIKDKKFEEKDFKWMVLQK